MRGEERLEHRKKDIGIGIGLGLRVWSLTRPAEHPPHGHLAGGGEEGGRGIHRRLQTSLDH